MQDVITRNKVTEPQVEDGDWDGRVETRLDLLRREREKGRRRLEALLSEQTETRRTLLRIDGAIQVLEELGRERTEPNTPRMNGDCTGT